MLKVRVFQDDETYTRRIEKKPYFISIPEKTYEELKDKDSEYLRSYFCIAGTLEGRYGRFKYQEVDELKKEKKLDLPNYVIMKWRMGTSLYSVYVPEDYYNGSEK